MNSTTWANVDTGIDLTLTGITVGDVIGVGLNFQMNQENVDTYLDVATIVSAAVVNYLSTATATPANFGLQGWVCSGLTYEKKGPEMRYVVQAGDLSAGTLVLRLRYRQPSAVNRTLNATGGQPFFWFATNYRH